MNIRNAAEQLCRDLQNSPPREELRELLWGLNISQDTRCEFGYYAREKYSQFLGYIIVDQEREMNGRMSSPLPQLTDEERNLLIGAHLQLARLNLSCVSELVRTHPHCSLAVDPYNGFSCQNLTNGLDLLSEIAIAQMASIFKKHPAITLAAKTAPSEVANLFHLRYMQDVCEMRRNLLEAGPHDSPEGLWQIYRYPNIDSKLRTNVLHLGALTSIRDSLANLNQLIFQAIMNDDLFTLNDENVIDVICSYGLTGHGALVTFLPPRGPNILGPNDIVKVQWTFNGVKLDRLGRIESHCLEPSPSFGEGDRADLRLLDDNLNSFRSLVSPIFLNSRFRYCNFPYPSF
jgi:hypothetical protein